MSELINRITKLAEVIKKAENRNIVMCSYYKPGQQVQVKFDEGQGFLSPCMGSVDGDKCKWFDGMKIEWGKSGDFDKDRKTTGFKCKKIGEVALADKPVVPTVNTNVSDNQPQGQQPGGQI